MINDQAKQYFERYGGFVVDPTFVPNTKRKGTMDSIMSTLTRFLAECAAELGLVEPRLAEHDLIAEQVMHGLPAQRRPLNVRPDDAYDSDDKD